MNLEIFCAAAAAFVVCLSMQHVWVSYMRWIWRNSAQLLFGICFVSHQRISVFYSAPAKPPKSHKDPAPSCRTQTYVCGCRTRRRVYITIFALCSLSASRVLMKLCRSNMINARGGHADFARSRAPCFARQSDLSHAMVGACRRRRALCDIYRWRSLSWWMMYAVSIWAKGASGAREAVFEYWLKLFTDKCGRIRNYWKMLKV